MKKGLCDVLDKSVFVNLTAEDVHLLMNGSPFVDIEVLKKITSFTDESRECHMTVTCTLGCTHVQYLCICLYSIDQPSDVVARFKQWFWAIVDKMTNEEKHDLVRTSHLPMYTPLHPQYTIPIPSVYSPYTLSILFLYPQYTPLHPQYTPPTPSLYSPYTVSILPYTLSILPLYRQYTTLHPQYTPPIPSVYYPTPSVYSPYTVSILPYTLSILPLYRQYTTLHPQYTPPIPSVYYPTPSVYSPYTVSILPLYRQYTTLHPQYTPPIPSVYYPTPSVYSPYTVSILPYTLSILPLYRQYTTLHPQYTPPILSYTLINCSIPILFLFRSIFGRLLLPCQQTQGPTNRSQASLSDRLMKFIFPQPTHAYLDCTFLSILPNRS